MPHVFGRVEGTDGRRRFLRHRVVDRHAKLGLVLLRWRLLDDLARLVDHDPGQDPRLTGVVAVEMVTGPHGAGAEEGLIRFREDAEHPADNRYRAGDAGNIASINSQ